MRAKWMYRRVFMKNTLVKLYKTIIISKVKQFKKYKSNCTLTYFPAIYFFLVRHEERSMHSRKGTHKIKRQMYLNSSLWIIVHTRVTGGIQAHASKKAQPGNVNCLGQLQCKIFSAMTASIPTEHIQLPQ